MSVVWNTDNLNCLEENYMHPTVCRNVSVAMCLWQKYDKHLICRKMSGRKCFLKNKCFIMASICEWPNFGIFFLFSSLSLIDTVNHWLTRVVKKQKSGFLIFPSNTVMWVSLSRYIDQSCAINVGLDSKSNICWWPDYFEYNTKTNTCISLQS